jgi:hypothetical protein
MFAALTWSPAPAEGPARKTVSVYVGGEELTRYCRSFMITRRLGQGTPQQLADAAGCYSYVTGVFDMLTELTEQGRIVLPFCIPEGTNAHALTEVVATFLGKNPERRNHSGADLVGTAWSESFPCPSR